MHLKVMSYNVKGHGARSAGYLERVAEVILRERPDVVGLQEVHRRTRASREDQAEALARLTGMEVHFGPSFAMGEGEFGNALLTSGEVRSAAVHPLPGAGEPRTLLETRVALRGAEIGFYVTHLAAWGPFRSSARLLQVRRLVEHLRRSEGPFILAGDLNATPRAPELRHLMAAELFRVCGELVCTHRTTRQCIDYVFADCGWSTVESRVVRAGPSDHWPVVVELRREDKET